MHTDVLPAADEALLALRADLQRYPGQPVALVIDPVLDDPLDRIRPATTVARTSWRIAHPDIDEASQPYLLWFEHEHAHEQAINAAVEIAVEQALVARVRSPASRSVCAWVTPKRSTTAPELAQRWSRSAAAVDEQGLRRILRFFDPRVVSHLPRVLGSDMLSAWLGAVDVWRWIDAEGQLRSFSPIDVVSSPSSLSAPMWRQLKRIGWINKLLIQSSEWEVRDRDALPAQLDRYMEAASEQRLVTEQDVLIFATCCHTLHAHFYKHDQVQDIVRRANTGGPSFAVAMSMMDEHTLEALSKAPEHTKESLAMKEKP
jgi:hypothetical protein